MKLPALLLSAVAGLGLMAGTALAADTIKIGNITALSGALKGVAETSSIAIDIAVKEINAKGGVNGKQIEIIRFDTGSDPKQASVGARKLIQDDGVLAVLGPFASGEAAVAFNDAERMKVLMIPQAASTPGLTAGKKYAWRLTADETKQFRRLLKAMKAANLKMSTAEIVYISDEAVSNSAGTTRYPELMKEAGITFGAPIPIQYKSFDMSAQAAKIVQSNPDLVAIAALPESASKVIKELRRQGYKGRIIGSQIFTDPNVVELFGPEGEGTLMVAGFWKGRTAQATAFDKQFTEESEKKGIHKLGAHHTDAQSYDGVYLMKQLIEKIGATGDATKLEAEREAMNKAMDGIRFTGIMGDNICFTGHDAELPGYVIEIKDGKWTKFAEVPADACAQ